jgi:hypothetical protein
MADLVGIVQIGLLRRRVTGLGFDGFGRYLVDPNE